MSSDDIDKDKLKKVQQDKDATLSLGFSNHVDEINAKILKLECTPGYEMKCSALIKDFKSKEKKTSNAELQKKIDSFNKAAQKTNRTVYAAEQRKDGIYITAAVADISR